ncbi:MAG TPA: ABC transporter permease [Kofleriaceae bacterium]|nr:ABC transporter permease [Kofleriaceae bacterium]
MLPTIRKELLLLKRDPRVLVRLIVLPVMFIVLFGMAFNASSKRNHALHRLVLFRDPAVTQGPALEQALGAHFAVAPATSAPEVARRVSAGDFDVGVVLPADLAPAAGRPAQVFVDPAAGADETGPLVAAVEGALRLGLAGGAAKDAPPVVTVVDPDTIPGAHVAKPSAFQLTVPGNAVLFGFFIALTCALGFAEERRSGTWRRLLAAPVAPWKLLAAKLVPYVVLGLVQVGTLFLLGALAFGMKVEGSVAALVVLSLGVACCATSLGLLIASVSSTEKQISSLGSVLILIMGLIGGCMFPRALMPAALKHAGLFVPHGWALDGYYALLVHPGTGFADVSHQLGAVYGFAAVFAIAGLRRFRFDA